MNRFGVPVKRVKEICEKLVTFGIDRFIVLDKESAKEFVDDSSHYHFAMLALIYKEEPEIIKDMLESIKSILDLKIDYVTSDNDSLIAKVNQRLLLVRRALGSGSEEKFKSFLARMYNSCFKASGEFLFGVKPGVCKYL